MFKKVWWFIGGLALLFSGTKAAAQAQNIPQQTETQWVDSVYNAMTRQQQIGQLLMVAAYSNRGPEHAAEIENLIEEYHLGGLIFFQGGPVRQARLTNRYQAASQLPLLVAMDAEWGLAMRLDSTLRFPDAMTLGAITNNQLVYNMGAEVARQCRRLGVHVNFAPVADVNSNAANPVIGFRSFGQNKHNVTAKARAYMKGMQDNRVLATGKHFPGHGDTDADSHLTLPVVKHNMSRLKEQELFPFERLIQDSLGSVMVAHLYIPALDSAQNTPTTLSPNVINGLLKKEMGFKGLIFTDALNMQGVAKYYKPGQIEVKALQAGNDVLLFPQDVPAAVAAITKALKRKKINAQAFEQSVKKVLQTKYRLGLTQPQSVNLDNLLYDLNQPGGKALRLNLYRNAITVVNNRQKLLPFKVVDSTYFASLTLGQGPGNAFQQTLSRYAPFQHFNLPRLKQANSQKQGQLARRYSQMFQRLRHFEVVVIGLHGISRRPKNNYGLNKDQELLIKELARYTNVVLVHFGSPYALKSFGNLPTILCAYEDLPETQRLAAEVLFGGIACKGRLPVGAGPFIPQGAGQSTPWLGRLHHALPEEQGMDARLLQRIDAIAQEAIDTRATPGCQIIVARNGAVVYEKYFGHFTYDKHQPVTFETVYDLASITKVAATLQAIMFLEERKAIDLDRRLFQYMPALRRTNKKNLTLRNILTHQAGLQPYIPFWKRTVGDSTTQEQFYRPFPEGPYTLEVGPGLYGHSLLKDSIWNWTIEADLREKRRRRDPYDYKYSDMGFYIMQRLAAERLAQPMEAFVDQNFYKPLGLSTLTYLPLCSYPISRITPTEQDTYFRNYQVRGMVHDQGAAMYGGIAGHAGLFSNAWDLATLMQMNLQDGYYGGTRYFKKGTVQRFSQKQFDENRRGLGWDKPAVGEPNGPTGRFASPATFGHTGFTGTAAWADPTFGLVYVFLSNRTYPDADNYKLISNNIRTRVMDQIYESIWSYQLYRQ